MRPEQATRPLFKEGCSHVLVPPELKRDCGHCHGLCCVLLYCSKSEGFPQDKPPGTPCIFLAADYRCSVHERLAEKGLSGCMAFDCLGAGQRLTRLLEGDVDELPGGGDPLRIPPEHHAPYGRRQRFVGKDFIDAFFIHAFLSRCAAGAA